MLRSCSFVAIFQVAARIEERIHRGRKRTAPTVAQHQKQTQALPQVTDRVVEASQHLDAETVAGDTSSIGTRASAQPSIAANGSCGAVRRPSPLKPSSRESNSTVDRNSATLAGLLDQIGKGPIPRAQPLQGVVRIMWDGPYSAWLAGEAIGDLNGHQEPSRCEEDRAPVKRMSPVPGQRLSLIRRYQARLLQPSASPSRRLIPDFDRAVFSHDWKDALWAGFFKAALQRRRRPVARCSIVKRA
jgi:hypothetical protein